MSFHKPPLVKLILIHFENQLTDYLDIIWNFQQNIQRLNHGLNSFYSRYNLLLYIIGYFI